MRGAPLRFKRIIKRQTVSVPRSSRAKITITSALIYANGEIHLGHVASTYLPPDVFTRYCRLKGYDVVHIGATDDFGTPILIRAEQEGKTPREYVRYWNKQDKKDFARLGISFDFFYKTSSNENIELTQYFFKRLNERGYLYTKEVSQPFCEVDQKFLPDRYVIGTCPFCGSPNQYSDGCEVCGRTFQPGEIKEARCAICGSRPVQKNSEHYFFRLSQFSRRLTEVLTSNSKLQAEVKNYVLNWIKEGLRDWDITRDIRWGVPIPLPEAKGKVLYGWFDNHIGYISSTLVYFKKRRRNGKRFWNSSTIYHFIGKDIIYHHYLFLQAMRLGLAGEFKLPDYIPTRGHLLLQGQKLSKSKGWYISLSEFLDRFPPDYLRYYLAAITPYSQSDVNFDWHDFQARINNELVANIGNFIHRVLTFVFDRFDAKIPAADTYDQLDDDFQMELSRTPGIVESELERNHIERALKKIVDFTAYCNQYFQRNEPWFQKVGTKTCIYLSVNAVKCLAILLNPFIPFTTKELWRQLNLKGSIEKQKWDESASLTVISGHTIPRPKPLFRKVTEEELAEQKEKLGKPVLTM